MSKQIKSYLEQQRIDYFLLPNSDEFFCEYLPESEKRIQYLTGFTGSNATIIFGLSKSYFFTDGRYVLQASQQLDLDEFEIINIAEESIISWIGKNVGEKKLALVAKLSSVNFVNAVKKVASNLVLLDENPVDVIWQDRPQIPASKIFSCEELSGCSSKEKIAKILKNLETDALLITNPLNLCWLLNIRASDIEFSPIHLSYGVLYKSGEVELFKGHEHVDGVENPVQRGGEIQLASAQTGSLTPSGHLCNITNDAKAATIQLDPGNTNYQIYQLLQKQGLEIVQKICPIDLLKAIKNEVEITGAIKAHEVDGLALTKFLFWIKSKKGSDPFLLIDEISAEEKLLEFRKIDPNFLYPSFASISGFASNGAVIHYRATAETNKKFDCNSLYLIDSGGQYFGEYMATTDVTRTIAIGTPTAEMIENFTRVLKGNIALARAKFPRGTTGAQLDALARIHLWHAGLDYDHGTGHGVGSFLSVHEGPCGISKRAHQELLEGIILSNEPGFYKTGEYGIRIENLMLVEKFDENFLQFKTLTLAPIDHDLVDFQMLTYPEKKWLYDYHETIRQKFCNCGSSDLNNWLVELANFYRSKSFN